jgi:hypothetical protein
MTTTALSSARRDAGTHSTLESDEVIVRARTTCAGAHVHVGSLKLPRDQVSEFAGRYRERADVSLLTKLTAAAANDIKGTLAPRMGLRVYAVAANAAAGHEPMDGMAGVSLALEIESPESDEAIERLVEAWRRELAPASLPEGASLHVSYRVLDWYAG